MKHPEEPLDDLLRFRDELGRPEPIPFDLDDLQDLKTAIGHDLEKTQGPWRKKGLIARYWPAFFAILIGLGAMFVMPIKSPVAALPSIASWIGTLTMLLCISAFALAPSRPSLAEKMSKVGLLFIVIALGFEVAAGVQSEVADLGNLQKCVSHIALFSLAPLALLVVLAVRAKAPLRKLHVLALSISVMSVGGVTVWRHCSSTGGLHILLSHVLPVTFGIILLGTILFRILQPKKTIIVLKN